MFLCSSVWIQPVQHKMQMAKKNWKLTVNILKLAPKKKPWSSWSGHLDLIILIWSSWSDLLDQIFLIWSSWSDLLDLIFLIQSSWFDLLDPIFLIWSSWSDLLDQIFSIRSSWYNPLDLIFFVPFLHISNLYSFTFLQLAKELYPNEDKFKPTPSHHFIKLLHDKGLLLRCQSLFTRYWLSAEIR
jgi:hypothetical protein